MVGDNSLSVKECKCEANSHGKSWEEMQHTHWKYVYTWEIHSLLLVLLPKELPSAPIESSSSLSISLSYWAQRLHAQGRISPCVSSSPSLGFWGLWSEPLL